MGLLDFKCRIRLLLLLLRALSYTLVETAAANDRYEWHTKIDRYKIDIHFQWQLHVETTDSNDKI